MSGETISQFLSTNWGWALALAASFFTITKFSLGLLATERKEELSLWLMGAAENTWAQSFCRMFDALFGENHHSLKCIIRSSAASLISVVGLWLMLGGTGVLAARTAAPVEFWQVVATGVAINLVADYVSLLETRLLLGQMHRWQAVWVQAGILLIDFLASGTIIFAAISLYVFSPLYVGESTSLGEILGAFSIFAVFFYSTFLTSVWTWGYILSTWFMRLFSRIGLARLLDVENRPALMVSTVGSICVFIGALAIAVPLQKTESGISRADELLCTIFPGQVCNAVATLTDNEQVQLKFIMLACAGGVTKQCLQRASDTLGTDDITTARLWKASCDGDDAVGCTNLGFMYDEGRGVDVDLHEAVRLFRQGCDNGNALGCTNLGLMYDEGHGVDVDLHEAVRLFRQGCDNGNALGCTNLGFMYGEGRGVDVDLRKAVRLFRQGCDGDGAVGCTNLGLMYENGRGVDVDLHEAVRLFRQGCDGDDAVGCTNLGFMYENGRGVDVDLHEAVRLFRQGCDNSAAVGCTNLGLMYENGRGVELDLILARKNYQKACSLGDDISCEKIEILN